ncbi:hypothetical protein ACB092_08G003300 [Castanea dentata]
MLRLFHFVSHLQPRDKDLAFCYLDYLELWIFICVGLLNKMRTISNLLSEQGGDSTKFQKVDVKSNVQLTPTSAIKENKRSCSVTSTKQQGRRYKD